MNERNESFKTKKYLLFVFIDFKIKSFNLVFS